MLVKYKTARTNAFWLYHNRIRIQKCVFSKSCPFVFEAYDINTFILPKYGQKKYPNSELCLTARHFRSDSQTHTTQSPFFSIGILSVLLHITTLRKNCQTHSGKSPQPVVVHDFQIESRNPKGSNLRTRDLLPHEGSLKHISCELTMAYFFDC